jgi:hypothetical protein
MESIPKYPRILAVVPNTPGFGYAVLEGHDVLVKWGTKWVRGDKNKGSLKALKQLLNYHHPHVLVLENISDTKRSERIRSLNRRMRTMTKSFKVPVLDFSKKELKQHFLQDDNAKKYDIAKAAAEKYPEELGYLLPPRRNFYDSEPPRMSVFEAVALALMVRHGKKARELMNVPLEGGFNEGTV